ncbi:MAG: hypothetical protein PHY54_16160 [Methylococcales bacterium]|nr:hypothetical protein [Methylococcales bacterium]
MNVSRSIPCELLSEQVDVVMHDIYHTINYFSNLNEERVIKTSYGLQCPSGGWNGLPEWINSAELHVLDGEIKLYLNHDNSEVALANIDNVADRNQFFLSNLFSHKTREFPSKVFCIGWPKTGTTSLTEALRMLGIFSWHFAPWVIGCRSFDSDISNLRMNLSSIAAYTSVSDVPVCVLFRELDQAFPDSKFILTTRREDNWLESAISQHGGLGQQRLVDAVSRWAYGTDQLDRQLFLNRYRQHHQQVFEYFKGRSDLLVIDISEDNQWSKLCDFLGLPVPNYSFPYLNKRDVISK